MRVEPRTYVPPDAITPPSPPRGMTTRAAAPPPPETPARVAFFAGLRAQAARTDTVGATSTARGPEARLDELRDDFSGPYTVEGSTITARPMFRMNGGANEASARTHASELRRIAARIGVSPEMIRLGQGNPRDLVRVTQALIDQGHLPPPPGALDARIRRMQWTWGIGVDCAGYTYKAVVAASGASPRALGLRALGMESFRSLDRNAAFVKIAPSSARPGDVITLDPLPPETVGHNVIVRSHTTNGTRHVIEVDSSWGAGADGADYGGFRRDTWIFDASTRLWTWTDPHVSPPVARSSLLGPAGERFHGCYRPEVRS